MMNFVDAFFDAKPPQVSGAPTGRDALRDRIVSGGPPQVGSVANQVV